MIYVSQRHVSHQRGNQSGEIKNKYEKSEQETG